jgi:hypothetical protein
MATAANIQEAIDDVVLNVHFPNSVTPYNDWMVNMFTPAGFDALAVGSAQFWDAASLDERTVFDWIIPSLITQRKIKDRCRCQGSLCGTGCNDCISHHSGPRRHGSRGLQRGILAMKQVATRKPIAFGQMLEGPYILQVRKRLPWGLIIVGLAAVGFAFNTI